MTKKFHASVQQRGSAVHLFLAGVIDEDAPLTDLTANVSAAQTVIHLSEVRRINSPGVREWVDWIRGLEARGIEIVLAECSPVIVAQLNMIPTFAGDGRIQSFYAPYVCPACEAEKRLLVDVATVRHPYQPPDCTCEKCGAAMEFDDLAEAYFAFLRGHPT